MQEEGERRGKRKAQSSCWVGQRGGWALGMNCTLWLGLSLSLSVQGSPIDGGSTRVTPLILSWVWSSGGGTNSLFSGVSEICGGEGEGDGSGRAGM